MQVFALNMLLVLVSTDGLRLPQLVDKPGSSKTPGMLKIFVYDLPPQFRRLEAWSHHRLDHGECEGADEEACVFGNLLNVSVDGTPGKITIRDVEQRSLGRIFHSLLKTYPGRVKDPETADLFFVPAFNENYNPKQHCGELNPISELKYLNKGNAHKHFMINPRVASHNDVCPWFESQFHSVTEEGQLFAEMVKLALEDKNQDFEEAAHHKGRATHLHSIPYPSFRSGLHPQELEQYKAAVAGANRTYLASAIWGNHGREESRQQRQQLQKQCTSSDDCLFISIAEDKRDDANTESIVPTMLKSKFCLQPEGDTVARKSLIDAISLGCIPVLVTERQKSLWPWHVKWDDVSVQIDDYTKDTLSYLRSIPDKEIKRLQSNLGKLSDIVSYGTSEQGHLAMEVTLRAVLSA